MSNSLQSHRLQPARLLCSWNSQARIREKVAISSTRESSQPRDRTHIFCISCWASGFFTTESPGKPSFHHIPPNSNVGVLTPRPQNAALPEDRVRSGLSHPLWSLAGGTGGSTEARSPWPLRWNLFLVLPFQR